MHERIGGASKTEQQCLEGEPLAGEAVQRGQTGDRHRADEKPEAGPRHPPQQAAELLNLPGPRLHENASCGEKQEAFEHRVIQHVVQTGRQSYGGDVAPPIGESDHPRAKAQENDPDVLNAVVRQESLQIVLHQRIEHPEHRRQASHNEDEHTPGQPRNAEAKCADANEPVNAGLDEHARHQRGDARRRRRMGLGQPDVERNDTGFHTEPKEEAGEQDVPYRFDHRISRQQCRE